MKIGGKIVAGLAYSGLFLAFWAGFMAAVMVDSIWIVFAAVAAAFCCIPLLAVAIRSRTLVWGGLLWVTLVILAGVSGYLVGLAAAL